jgi:hypothetical protein
MASNTTNLPQQPFANGEPDVAPAPQYNNAAPAQQTAPGAAPMVAMPQTEIASTNNVTANSYGNTQAAANVWQANRGYSHP